MMRLFTVMVSSLIFWSGMSAQSAPDSGWMRVVTTPSGASVFVDGRLAGTSPIDSLLLPAGPHTIQIQRDSPYRWTARAIAESIDVHPGELSLVNVVVPREILVRTSPPGNDPGPAAGLVMTGPGASGLRSDAWTLTAGGAMVASGILAAVFRARANDSAARYQQTRDSQALADVRTYDRLAGASMVAVQVSLATFVLFLTGQ